MLFALLLTACSAIDQEEAPTPREATKLNVYVYLPERPNVTRADNGEVSPIDNTVNEAKITSLQIWVFEHSTKDLVAYYKPETAPDPTTDRSPVTYLLNVSDAFDNAVTKPNVDVYVMANVEGYDEATTATQLDNAMVNNSFRLTQPVMTEVPAAGLPMTGVKRNVSVGGQAPVFTVPNIELTRAVSKLRFVMSRDIAPEEQAATPVSKPVKIVNIKMDAEMVPMTAYLFLADDNKKYHVGTSYNSSVFDFLNGQPLSDIQKNDDPMAYAYQTGTSAQAYEDLLASGLINNELTQVGPYYLFESDKQLSGVITFRGPDDSEDKTATFTMSDAGDFTRNHTWTVYAYYGSTRLEVVTVFVNNWTEYKHSDHPIYNW